MLRVIGLIGLFASPAMADAVVVTGCVVEPSNMRTHSIRCDVENASDTAIARLNHRIAIFQTGRSVPWANIGSERRPEPISVPGGIEPGETLNITMGYFDIFENTPIDQLYGEITIYPPDDVNGDPITD